MVTLCSKCGNPIRHGARFCPRCGQSIAQAQQPAAASPQPVSQPPYTPPPYSPPSPHSPQPQAQAVMQQAAQMAGKAAAVAGPVVQAAGGAAWQASKSGMGWFTRLVTLGGRAAYTEVFNPQSAAEGPVTMQPMRADTPAPIEPAGLVFALSFVIWPLVFLVQGALAQLVIFPVVAVLLLALNFVGLRWPSFTKLTFGSLLRRYIGGHVPELRFQVHDAQKGVCHVRVVGVVQGNVPLAAGQLVRVYGTPEAGRNEVRAWKMDVYTADGQPLGILTAPRVLPLFAMLFAPTTLWFIIWLVVQIVRLAGR